jgi:beta-galactosidase beta subunit
MTEDEMKILKMPISELLQKKLLPVAMALREKQLQKVDAANKAYVSKLKPGKVHVQMDSIEVKSMADGKTYTSKSQLKDSYKRHDVHIVEKGEAAAECRERKEIRGDYNCKAELKQALQKHLPR